MNIYTIPNSMLSLELNVIPGVLATRKMKLSNVRDIASSILIVIRIPECVKQSLINFYFCFLTLNKAAYLGNSQNFLKSFYSTGKSIKINCDQGSSKNHIKCSRAKVLNLIKSCYLRAHNQPVIEYSFVADLP